MEQQPINVQFGLRGVNEVNYIYRPEKLEDNIDPQLLQISFMNNIRGLEVEKNFISIVFGARFSYKNENILECVYGFDFNVKDLSKFVQYGEKNNVTINVIMPYLLDVAVGTLRGLILAKTYGTPLYKFPLPVINIEQMIKGMRKNGEQVAN